MEHSVHSSHYTASPAPSWIALAGFILTVIAAAIGLLSGIGSRLGLWHFSTGFVMLRVAFFGGLLSGAVSLAGAVITRPGTWRGGYALSVAGLAISFVLVVVPLSWYVTAREMPRIHDITTDTDDPPLFVKILPLREHAPNPAAYGGPDVAARQHAAYPDIKPLTLMLPPDRAFDRALAAGRSLGWTIVNTDRQEGRFEGLVTTFWFGFTDDIVVRVRPEGDGSRIDIRSVSRVGVSDVGTNAERIRAFLKKLSPME